MTECLECSRDDGTHREGCPAVGQREADHPLCHAQYMGSYARTRICEKPAGHDGDHDWADFYRADMKPNGAPYGADSTGDAGKRWVLTAQSISTSDGSRDATESDLIAALLAAEPERRMRVLEQVLKKCSSDEWQRAAPAGCLCIRYNHWTEHEQGCPLGPSAQPATTGEPDSEAKEEMDHLDFALLEWGSLERDTNPPKLARTISHILDHLKVDRLERGGEGKGESTSSATAKTPLAR